MIVMMLQGKITVVLHWEKEHPLGQPPALQVPAMSFVYSVLGFVFTICICICQLSKPTNCTAGVAYQTIMILFLNIFSCQAFFIHDQNFV